MPTDRLLRYTIAGSTLLTSLMFFFWLLGGDVQTIIDFRSGEYLLKIVALILTTPSLGIMVSLICFEFLVRYYGYKVYYYVPMNKTLIEWILEEKETTDVGEVLRQKLASGDENTRKFEREFYPFYQVKVRKHIKGTSLRFLDTKWSVIWIHRNIIAALIISLLLMLPYLRDNYQNLYVDNNPYKIIGLAFICIYIAAAYYHIKYALSVAKRYEHKLLMNAREKEKQKLRESLPVKKRIPITSIWRLLTELLGITA